MAEYIEREAALAFQNELEPMVCKSIMTDELFSATKDSDLVAFLQNIPSADVVTRDCYDCLLSENDKLRKVRPVVICENCKHCLKLDEHESWCKVHSPMHLVRPDDWCSRGEERDDG